MMIHELLNNILPFRLLGIGCAILCGFIIGLERQLSGKPAGIRTSILICIGTYAFIVLSTIIETKTFDGSRVLGQVITGIGFLGAGLIFNKDGLVNCVTSAAVIWVMAGIGSLIGFEKYGAAITLTIMTVMVLTIIGVAEHKFRKLRQGVHEENESNDNDD